MQMKQTEANSFPWFVRHDCLVDKMGDTWNIDTYCVEISGADKPTNVTAKLEFTLTCHLDKKTLERMNFSLERFEEMEKKKCFVFKQKIAFSMQMPMENLEKVSNTLAKGIFKKECSEMSFEAKKEQILENIKALNFSNFSEVSQ